VSDRDNEATASTDLSLATEAFPYPVARSVRAYVTEFDPTRRYDYLLDAAEKLILWMGILGLSWAMNQRALSHVAQEWLSKMRTSGVSLGTWLDVCFRTRKEMSRRGVDFAGYATALRRKKGGDDFSQALQALVNERNRRSHGEAPRTTGEVQQRLKALEVHLSKSLAEANFLADIRWILPVELHFDRMSETFEVTVQSLVGAQLFFATDGLTQEVPLAEHEIYASIGEGDDLVLTPFCVYRTCPVCLKNETFYADRILEDRIRYKSFDEGHVFTDEGLLEQLDAAFAEDSIFARARAAADEGVPVEATADSNEQPEEVATTSHLAPGPSFVAAPAVRLAEPTQLDESLFYLTNRLTPIKIAVRKLARMMTAYEWPALEDFQWEAAEAAREIGRRLKRSDTKKGLTYWDKRAVGFPVGRDEYRSCRAFISRFTIEWAGGKERGPLAILGLARVERGRVGLTQAGWDLALERNPVLDGAPGILMTDAEQRILRKQLLWAKKEAEEIRTFLDAVRLSDGIQAHLDVALAEAYPHRPTEITELRGAMIGRLKDASVLSVEGIGPTSVVTVTQHAAEFIN
jgi:hypothetical protein